jgi:hypothetical protein
MLRSSRRLALKRSGAAMTLTADMRRTLDDRVTAVGI